MRITPSRSRRLVATGAALACLCTTGVSFAQVDLTQEANTALGLRASTVLELDIKQDVGRPLSFAIPVDGRSEIVDLRPFSVRAAGYQVLVQRADGQIVHAPASEVRTMRGELRGSDLIVTGSLLQDGLHAAINTDNGRYWLQPLAGILDLADAGDYVLYAERDVMEVAGRCATPDVEFAKDKFPQEGQGEDGIAGGNPCIAELAADADVQYFNLFGSVAGTENRINNIINTVNVQYENQVGITHLVTTILVRTAEPDPYTSSDSSTLLCQFITEWTNNQGGIQRDVAVLFTGRDINGGVIGQAADIGGTGICVNNGGCQGGPFGTFGSYCIAQAEFNGSFSCATDLIAHELGHLWGAFHCSCPGNTMNPSITCANNFSAGSISSINAYAATRSCLDGPCEAGGGPDNNNCVDRTDIFNGDTLFSTVGATTDGAPTNGLGDCDDFGDPQIHNDIWFNYQADFTGTMTVSTCDLVDYDSKLAVYLGCACPASNNNLIACNDDGAGCGNFTSELQVDVNAGSCYKIRVGGFGAGDAGGGTIRLTKDVVVPTGACCINGNCVILSAGDCASQGGDYQGDGTNCNGNPCFIPTGACCIDQNCFILSADDCASQGGDYQGDGTNCNGNPCFVPITGGCCVDTDCFVLSASECTQLGGDYLGDGTTCAGDPCAPDPTGACCIDANCAVVTAADCASFGGTYLGDGTDCANNPCGDDNNFCDGREVIFNGDTQYSTAGATTDGAPVDGNGSPQEGDCNEFGDPQIHNDIWFNYTADFSGALNLSTCDLVDYDSKVAVYEGCGCPATNANLVGCNDDGPGCGGFTSLLSVDVAAGQCYKVRVGGFGAGDAGGGVLQLTKDPVANCPWDLNGDGNVGPADLANILDNWGPNPGNPADFNGDGEVGPADLAKVLDNWGDCP